MSPSTVGKRSGVTFSIVTPIYNEIDSIRLLYRRLRTVMDRTRESWEMILVDDGSTDGSGEAIRALARQDRRVVPVFFARNFGHQIAVTAGLDFSRGRAVVIVDADLQDPPEVIPQLIQRWREGYHVVYAVRAEREGESWFKEVSAALFYRVIFRITDVKIPLDTGDFRLLDRRVVDALGQMRERHRFLRGMAAWVGFSQIGVPYRREARRSGVTKYPIQKMVRLALNAVTGFSYFPLQIATYLGFLAAGV
ncbi:MAG: glycosyltransferase family 2 protein, partial [Anaerolineales bacterium]